MSQNPLDWNFDRNLILENEFMSTRGSKAKFPLIKIENEDEKLKFEWKCCK